MDRHLTSPPVVTVENLYKEFDLPHERHSSLKQAAVNIFRKIEIDHLKVLEDVSFEVHEGEFFGIIGRNGSGKSTMLKILAEIYEPTRGSVQVIGRTAPFVELGVGFNNELTGRDNIFLNGAIFGMTKQELLDRYDSIVAFAELEQFMDQKLKNYSTGMQVRLAFSIAIQADADVIIMDEVLAVGDASFREKCFDVFRRLKADGKTIILVTHDMSNVERFCDRVLVLDRGVTYGVMDARVAALTYNRLNSGLAAEPAEDETSAITVASMQLCSPGGAAPWDHFPVGSALEAVLRLKRPEGPRKDVTCTLVLEREDSLQVARMTTRGTPSLLQADELTVRIPSLPLLPGAYALKVILSDRMDATTDDRVTYAADFVLTSVDHKGQAREGVLALGEVWTGRVLPGD